MDTTQANPITQRLTRTIDPSTQKARMRLAIGAPAIFVAAVTATIAALVMATPMAGLVVVALVLMMLVLAVLPAITAVASSTLTYQEVQSENFQFLQISALTKDEIVDGFIAGIKLRLLPLRRAGEFFAIAVTTAPFIAVVVVVLSASVAAPPSGYDFIFILSSFVSYAVYTFVLAVGLWGVTYLLNEMAVLAGVNLAIWLRNTNVSMSNMAAALIVLVVGVVGIGWLVMSLLQTAATIFMLLMLIGGFAYMLVQSLVVH